MDNIHLLLHTGGEHFESHCVRHRTDFKSKCIPLTVHGDGTPMTGIGKAWGKSIDVWSWTSMLHKGPSALTMFLIYAVQAGLRCADAGRNTLDVVFRKMAWSFNALYSGMWPTHDWDNKPMHYSKAVMLQIVYILTYSFRLGNMYQPMFSIGG